ncbi:GAF domain-containing protein [Sporosarcina sp. HYO08]|uniref:GAF domain-containing protein n=1 Tax=Sporosarcina sp. HYO08 TaxID=1759557 RepID=UPI000797112D|nr:GAF domain-containing protein [Sporosarcina sp. HYO08]KXH83853.1 hypothetical protein AU377_03585 [Sporosarcina sp. HYO08]
MEGQEKFNYQEEIERFRKHFQFDFIGVALIQSANGETKWRFVSGNQSNRYKRIVLQTGKGVIGLVLKTGRPVIVEDVEQMIGKTNLYKYPLIIAEKLQSFGVIPLYKYNRVKGVLLVGYRSELLTSAVFTEFQRQVGPVFGEFYNKEMVESDGDK